MAILGIYVRSLSCKAPLQTKRVHIPFSKSILKMMIFPTSQRGIPVNSQRGYTNPMGILWANAKPSPPAEGSELRWTCRVTIRDIGFQASRP